MAIGLSLESALWTVVWWYCWTFGICRKFWHKSRHPFSWWASSTLLELVCVPMTVTLNGFHKSLHVFRSWRSPLLQDPETLGMGRRSLSCTRHPSSRRIVLLRPSAFLWPLSHLVRLRFLSKRLTAWSSRFQNLSPAHRRNLLVKKAKKKRVHYQGQSHALLKWLWQGGQLARSLL